MLLKVQFGEVLSDRWRITRMSDDDLITYKCYHAGLEKWFDPDGPECWTDVLDVKMLRLVDEEDCLTTFLNHVGQDLDAAMGVWIVPCVLGAASNEGVINLEPDFLAGYEIDVELTLI